MENSKRYRRTWAKVIKWKTLLKIEFWNIAVAFYIRVEIITLNTYFHLIQEKTSIISKKLYIHRK